MKRFIFLLWIMPASVLANHQTLTYEPAVMEISGTLDLQTFPGPPNFDSIKNGDDIERHFYLKLDEPVDVVPLKNGHPTVSNPEPEKNVKIMQLAIDANNGDLWARFRKAGKNAHVKITGTLFHRFTGHHHSRVLLSVQKMQMIPH